MNYIIKNIFIQLITHNVLIELRMSYIVINQIINTIIQKLLSLLQICIKDKETMIITHT
jgi:hypothetical protein